MNHNRRSDTAGFPGGGAPPKKTQSASAFPSYKPPNRPMPSAYSPDDGNKGVQIDREAIDNSLSSLGGVIHMTIMWHMNSRGVFADPKRIEINFHCDNLRELVGPGADMIMVVIWTHLQKGRGF